MPDKESNLLTGKTEDGETVYIGSRTNLCCICGQEIPEGIEVCPSCEVKN